MKRKSEMEKRIDFLDLKKQYADIREEVLRAIENVCENTAFSSGVFVTQFENNFASFLGGNVNVAGVNNGTSALHLCMLALGIGPGDEVIVPANTFIASAWGPCHAGATPVFTDCDPLTWNIDVKQVRERITKKTRAIIGVHLYGQPCELDELRSIARENNLFLVEDCAQSHGAKYKGKSTGTTGDISAFSFYPGKNLGAYGEAGAVVSHEKTYIDKVRMLINQGSGKKYYHETIGYNMRMDGIQAAVLDVKLRHLAAWTKRRQAIAKIYRENIRNPKIRMQETPPYAEHVYHLFVITSDDRDGLMSYLNAHHIFPGIHYPVPIHLQKAFAHLGYRKGDFPNAEFLAEHCLSLPLYPELSDDSVQYVIEKLNSW
ncbi:MAG TPA: DegT/DnrJ/EryC1/StrS family aminotransferase [Bacteroidia bacterium]|nr:DegT/DnrJ/EryC1/StrS family aminotransferase [Bacteroidia bacterium]